MGIVVPAYEKVDSNKYCTQRTPECCMIQKIEEKKRQLLSRYTDKTTEKKCNFIVLKKTIENTIIV